MKLIGSLTSPYVRKVRIVLKEKGIACEFIVDNPNDAASQVPQHNPLGKIPTLLLDNGKSLYDSVLLVDYLDSLKGERLIPSGDARWDVQRWHMLGQGILDAVVARMLEGRRAQPLPEAIARQEGKIARALAAANATERGARYLVGERFSLADIALGVALEYIDFRYPHDWRGQYPRLAQWLRGIAARNSFAETVPPGMERAADARPTQ